MILSLNIGTESYCKAITKKIDNLITDYKLLVNKIDDILYISNDDNN